MAAKAAIAADTYGRTEVLPRQRKKKTGRSLFDLGERGRRRRRNGLAGAQVLLGPEQLHFFRLEYGRYRRLTDHAQRRQMTGARNARDAGSAVVAARRPGIAGEGAVGASGRIVHDRGPSNSESNNEAQPDPHSLPINRALGRESMAAPPAALVDVEESRESVGSRTRWRYVGGRAASGCHLCAGRAHRESRLCAHATVLQVHRHRDHRLLGR
jgi:hypothetical protein